MSSLDVSNNPRESGQLLTGKLRRYSQLQQPQPHQLTTSHMPIKASPVSAPPSPAMGAAGCVLRGAVLVTDTQSDGVPTLGSGLLILGRIRAEVWGRAPRAKGWMKEEEFGPCTQCPFQYPSRQQGGLALRPKLFPKIFRTSYHFPFSSGSHYFVFFLPSLELVISHPSPILITGHFLLY